MRARDARTRRAAAERGLARASATRGGDETERGDACDTEVLLLRQLYKAHLEQRELVRAARVAERAAALESDLRDIAWHDAARAYAGANERLRAIQAQRLATRTAPAERKSFQLWSLGTLQHHTGDAEGAVATLRRAMRYAQRDRALLRAHAAYVRMDAGLPVRGLRRTIDALRASPNHEGYGRFLLGMIAHLLGDDREASVQLGAFCRRNASGDPARALTLAEELRRAQRVLASIDAS